LETTIHVSLAQSALLILFASKDVEQSGLLQSDQEKTLCAFLAEQNLGRTVPRGEPCSSLLNLRSRRITQLSLSLATMDWPVKRSKPRFWHCFCCQRLVLAAQIWRVTVCPRQNYRGQSDPNHNHRRCAQELLRCVAGAPRRDEKQICRFSKVL